jgi:hypothetical protein
MEGPEFPAPFLFFTHGSCQIDTFSVNYQALNFAVRSSRLNGLWTQAAWPFATFATWRPASSRHHRPHVQDPATPGRATGAARHLPPIQLLRCDRDAARPHHIPAGLRQRLHVPPRYTDPIFRWTLCTMHWPALPCRGTLLRPIAVPQPGTVALVLRHSGHTHRRRAAQLRRARGLRGPCLRCRFLAALQSTSPLAAAAAWGKTGYSAPSSRSNSPAMPNPPLQPCQRVRLLSPSLCEAGSLRRLRPGGYVCGLRR